MVTLSISSIRGHKSLLTQPPFSSRSKIFFHHIILLVERFEKVIRPFKQDWSYYTAHVLELRPVCFVELPSWLSVLRRVELVVKDDWVMVTTPLVLFNLPVKVQEDVWRAQCQINGCKGASCWVQICWLLW